MTSSKNRELIFIQLLLLVFANLNLAFVNKAQNGTLTIQLNNCAGNALLRLDSITYNNALGQPYTVSKFKYYIGNICLAAVDGSIYKTHGYYLIDEEDNASKKIVIQNIPANTFTSIEFTLGVDSIDNCSGAQSGALDPVNGMFWTWNSGYIFLKIEGHADASKSPGHIFEFHIGGYKNPPNCIRNVILNFINHPLQIAPDKEARLVLKADAFEIFNASGEGYKAVDFAAISSVTDFHHATEIADNYSHMFSIQKIEP
jgi:hypothetical protein